MSEKYLKALKILDYHNDLKKYWGKEFDVVEQALQRLKSIDNANPSEALECSLKLYKMVESAGNGNGFSLNEAWKYYKTIKQALNELQAIKNAEPSDALKVLNCNPIIREEMDYEDYYTINKALLKAQENEKEFGCPLDIVAKALKQSTFKGLYFDTVDTDGYKRKGFVKCYLDYDGFTNRFFWNTGWNGDVWLSSHKKTWWLKENKEE